MLMSFVSRISSTLVTKNSKFILNSQRTKYLLNNIRFKRLFSEQKSELRPKEKKNTPKEEESTSKDKNKFTENKEVESNNTSKFDATKFEQLNSKSFLEKMERMESANRPGGRALENIAFPLFLSLTSCLIYFLWRNVPFSVIYKFSILMI